MNKNEALARCRHLWSVIADKDIPKWQAEDLIHGDTDPFHNICPLCEYNYDDGNDLDAESLNCNNCIQWDFDPNSDYNDESCPCERKGSSYRLWVKCSSTNRSHLACKMVALIDKAIAIYDKTGAWK